MFYIYSITNIKNNKKYIGFTNNPKRRWTEHKRHSKTTPNAAKALYGAIRKDGLDNFIFEIIFQHEDKNYTKNIMEPKLIIEHNSKVPFGYNIGSGGEGYDRTGAVLSDETKAKISKSVKQTYKDNPELLEAISKRNKGKKTSDETKAKISKHHSTSRWVSNDTTLESIFIQSELLSDYLDKGWVEGRKYNWEPTRLLETRSCLECSTTFECIPSSRKRFCNKSCGSLFNMRPKRKEFKEPNTKCYYCSTPIYKKPCELIERNFCNKSCRMIWQNKNR